MWEGPLVGEAPTRTPLQLRPKGKVAEEKKKSEGKEGRLRSQEGGGPRGVGKERGLLSRLEAGKKKKERKRSRKIEGKGCQRRRKLQFAFKPLGGTWWKKRLEEGGGSMRKEGGKSVNKRGGRGENR